MRVSDDQFVRMFQLRAGLEVDGDVGPNTLAKLDALLPPPQAAAVPPWITIAYSVLGLHERRDNAELAKFLRRDGPTLGDPKAMPWCGDFVDTCIELALPAEPRQGDLGRNPYWALNWALLGNKSDALLGSVAVKRRQGGGHVTFPVGEDATHFYCLGGNQDNEVNISRFLKDSFLAIRAPKTWAQPLPPLPRMSPGSTPTNPSEA